MTSEEQIGTPAGPLAAATTCRRSRSVSVHVAADLPAGLAPHWQGRARFMMRGTTSQMSCYCPAIPQTGPGLLQSTRLASCPEPVTCGNVVEPVTRIELACPAWESTEPPHERASHARLTALCCPLQTPTYRYLWSASGPTESLGVSMAVSPHSTVPVVSLPPVQAVAGQGRLVQGVAQWRPTAAQLRETYKFL